MFHSFNFAISKICSRKELPGQILTSLTQKNREICFMMEKNQRLETVPSQSTCLTTQMQAVSDALWCWATVRNPNRVTLIICALELWTSLAVDVMEVIKLRDELLKFIEQVQALTKLFRRLVLHFKMGVNDLIIFLVQ